MHKDLISSVNQEGNVCIATGLQGKKRKKTQGNHPTQLLVHTWSPAFTCMYCKYPQCLKPSHAEGMGGDFYSYYYNNNGIKNGIETVEESSVPTLPLP